MRMLDDHAKRIIREPNPDARSLAEELYTLLTRRVKLLHHGPVEFNNTTTDPGLVLRDYSAAPVMVKLDGADGVQTLAAHYAVPLLGVVVASLGDNQYTVQLFEHGLDEDATGTVTAVRQTPPAGTSAVSDKAIVLRIPNGFDDDDEPVYDYLFGL